MAEELVHSYWRGFGGFYGTSCLGTTHHVYQEEVGGEWKTNVYQEIEGKVTWKTEEVTCPDCLKGLLTDKQSLVEGVLNTLDSLIQENKTAKSLALSQVVRLVRGHAEQREGIEVWDRLIQQWYDCITRMAEGLEGKEGNDG